jgi:UDP-2-acetamido-2,6-beta-L-arabino-hexul-4-ose reductase
MSKTIIETLKSFRDARGALFEPADDRELAAAKNVHVVLTEPGFVRGNHRHVVGNEITTITGPAEVRLKEDGVIRDVVVPAGEIWRFHIPAGVTHAFRNPGPGLMVLAAFNSEVHDPAHPDAVRDEIL